LNGPHSPDDAAGKLFAENLTIQVIGSATLDTSLPTDWATGFYQHYG
jgi:hypothetical protein